MKKLLILFCLICAVSLLNSETSWLGKDKVLHFTGSAFLTYWNYGISRDILGNSETESKMFGIGISILLGSGKETGDKYLKKTKWSWQDLTYDLLGISLGLVMINNVR